MNNIDNSFIISGEMTFIFQDKAEIKVNGYFEINLTSLQIFPYFDGPNEETSYDYASGNEDEFHDFLDEIFDENFERNI